MDMCLRHGVKARLEPTSQFSLILLPALCHARLVESESEGQRDTPGGLIVRVVSKGPVPEGALALLGGALLDALSRPAGQEIEASTHEVTRNEQVTPQEYECQDNETA